MRISSVGKPAFTVVELIVVIAMIGILATMIMPRLSGSARATGLRVAGRRLQVTAQYARDYAVTHRRICRLVLDRQEGRYGLVAQSDPERNPAEYERLKSSFGRAELLGHGLTFGEVRIDRRFGRDGDAAGGDSIGFDPFGRADAAAVQVTDGRYAYTVLVAPYTARVTLIEGAETELLEDREDLDG